MQESSSKEILIGSIVYYKLIDNAEGVNIAQPDKEWKGLVVDYIPVRPRLDLSVVIVELLEDDPEYWGLEDYILAAQITRIEKEEQL